jgi:hypothetical protein
MQGAIRRVDLPVLRQGEARASGPLYTKRFAFDVGRRLPERADLGCRQGTQVRLAQRQGVGQAMHARPTRQGRNARAERDRHRRGLDPLEGARRPRNIQERLPKSLHVSVRRVLRQAWELNDADKAEKLVRNLARSLERDWSGVVGSIPEGIEEIFTVTRLGLPAQLRRSLACT